MVSCIIAPGSFDPLASSKMILLFDVFPVNVSAILVPLPPGNTIIVPSKTVEPTTSNFALGEVVPTPTSPEAVIRFPPPLTFKVSIALRLIRVNGLNASPLTVIFI